MIVLSGRGWPASAIAELLGYDPVIVRRGSAGSTGRELSGLADRLRSGRPRLGSPKLGQRIRRLLARPRAWTIPLLCTCFRVAPRCHARTQVRRRALTLPVREVSANASWVLIAILAHNLLCAGVAALGALQQRPGRGQGPAPTPADLLGRLRRSSRRRTLHLPDRWPSAQAVTRALARLWTVCPPA